MDILTFFVHARDFQAFPLVVDALETLSTANDETPTPYAYWFKSMEHSLSAGNGILPAGGPDSLTNDYAVCAPVPPSPSSLVHMLLDQLHDHDEWYTSRLQ